MVRRRIFNAFSINNGAEITTEDKKTIMITKHAYDMSYVNKGIYILANEFVNLQFLAYNNRIEIYSEKHRTKT